MPTADTRATISVNQYFEALKEDGVWYIRNKKAAHAFMKRRDTWGPPVSPPAAGICEDVLAGRVLPTDNPRLPTVMHEIDMAELQEDRLRKVAMKAIREEEGGDYEIREGPPKEWAPEGTCEQGANDRPIMYVERRLLSEVKITFLDKQGMEVYGIDDGKPLYAGLFEISAPGLNKLAIRSARIDTLDYACIPERELKITIVYMNMKAEKGASLMPSPWYNPPKSA